MRFLGFDITRKATPELRPVVGRDRSWYNLVREPYTGAWQRNDELRRESILTYHAVYSCITLIASDVAKCNIRLVEQDRDGIWTPVESAAFSPVLRKPNRYQNRIKFYEQWVVSKLVHGNTYVLKQRDARGLVVKMYILDPTRCKPLVSPDGGIYYEIRRDNLSGVETDTVTVPASEIIHDVMVPLYHPLCGVSPLTACGLAAAQGLHIQNNSSTFFLNGSQPGGVLTAPAKITDEAAQRLKDYWETKFSGANAGKVAVLGDGLKYEQMALSARDSQLIEQLKWSGEVVCSTFHVPAYKVGVAAAPAYNNIEALDQQYYAQCLQKLFECIELCLDEGLGLVDVPDKVYGTEFDLDDLLRMDTATLVEAEAKATGAGIKKLDEARKRLNLTPMKGGNAAYLQQQNYSVEALAKRDAQADPFKMATSERAAPPQEPDDPELDDDEPAKAFDAAVIGQMAAWELRAQLARLPVAAA